MDPATLESLLVREIRKASEISRRDLADKLDVARSTAGRRVDSLIKRGLLREKGIEDRTRAGRPKRLLALQGDYGTFAGFDFDARHLFVVLVDFAQQTVEEHRFPLPDEPTREHVLRFIRNLLTDYSKENGKPLLGVGIGVPGRVDQERRIALGYPYIDGWENVDLLSELDLTADRLHIENNTRTIALGEYWLGNPEPAENLACISVRTGISAAVISDGRLIRGCHEMAGEIRGWRIQAPAGKRKTPVPWLEDTATIRALAKGRGKVPNNWLDFAAACRQGNPEALARLDQFADLHADAAARIVQLVDPERIVFSGVFNQLGDLYLDRLTRSLASALEGHYFSPPPIGFVSLGEFSGAQGAAALAAAHFKPR